MAILDRDAPASAQSVAEITRRRGASSGVIARELRQAIADGHFRAGERLPTEREMAEHYGTSRASVRTALREIEAAGLISRRVGAGTFVKDQASDDKDIADVTSPLELLEVRLVVEPNITRLAAQNASARDVERLREALEHVEACGDDIEHFTHWDQQFHLLLAECTRNPLMVWLYKHLNEVRERAQWEEAKTRVLTRARMEEYNVQHRAVFEAVVGRDAEHAGSLMAAHIDKARRDMLGPNAAP